MSYAVLAASLLLIVVYFLWKSLRNLKKENKTLKGENEAIKEKHSELLSKVTKIQKIYEETGNATRDELISILRDADSVRRSGLWMHDSATKTDRLRNGRSGNITRRSAISSTSGGGL